MKNNNELIRAYFNDKLSPEETKQVEEKIIQNLEFAAAVERYRKRFLERTQDKNLMEEIKAFRNSNLTEKEIEILNFLIEMDMALDQKQDS
ncbi:MAG: hypothetical protein HC880_15990 [Bacteroidia bacterium]|nr:hypothetical protein [Bacteroidia bacterium]